jgi:hypothetical protein
MSYRGDPANIGIPELESVRRLREGAVRLPDGSGFFVGTVGKKKKKESSEGGPGSGPRKGKHSSRDSKEQHSHVKQVEKTYSRMSTDPDTPRAHTEALKDAINKSSQLRQAARQASAGGDHDKAMRLLGKAEKGMDKAWGAAADAYNLKHWGTKNPD